MDVVQLSVFLENAAGRLAEVAEVLAAASVNVRALSLADMAEFGVGGGIVWDSVESAEFEECRTKASILTYSMQEFSLLETMSWKPRTGYVLMEKHLERLSESAAYFDRHVDMDALEPLD